jgi:hypothetical protein
MSISHNIHIGNEIIFTVCSNFTASVNLPENLIFV